MKAETKDLLNEILERLEILEDDMDDLEGVVLDEPGEAEVEYEAHIARLAHPHIGDSGAFLAGYRAGRRQSRAC